MIRTLKFIVCGIAGVVLGTMVKKFGVTMQQDLKPSGRARDEPDTHAMFEQMRDMQPVTVEVDVIGDYNSPELTRFVRQTLGRWLPDEDDKLEWN